MVGGPSLLLIMILIRRIRQPDQFVLAKKVSTYLSDQVHDATSSLQPLLHKYNFGDALDSCLQWLIGEVQLQPEPSSEAWVIRWGATSMYIYTIILAYMCICVFILLLLPKCVYVYYVYSYYYSCLQKLINEMQL